MSELGRLASANLERVGITETTWQEWVDSARKLTEEIGEWGAGLASAG